MAASALKRNVIGPFDRAIEDAFAFCTKTQEAKIGPFVARLRFSGDPERLTWMSAMVPAGLNAGVPDLEVAILEVPVPAVAALKPKAAGEHFVVDDARYIAAWSPAPHAMLHLYDKQRRRGLLWIENGDAPGWIRSRPILPIIHSFLLDTDWVPVHSAAVGLDGKFLLIAGQGGSGKTTAALACARAGWTYAGDDYVMINARDGIVAPLYPTARVRPPGRSSFAALIDDTRVAVSFMGTDERDELRLNEHEIGSRVEGGPFVCWLMPDRRGATSPTFAPARALPLYQSLIIASVVHPWGREQTSAKMLKAIKLAPAYSVDTGTVPDDIPSAFADLLRSLET